MESSAQGWGLASPRSLKSSSVAGGKAGLRSTDTGRWGSMMVGAGGSSFIYFMVASVFFFFFFFSE